MFSGTAYHTKTWYKTGTSDILTNFIHRMNSDFNMVKLTNVWIFHDHCELCGYTTPEAARQKNMCKSSGGPRNKTDC